MKPYTVVPFKHYYWIAIGIPSMDHIGALDGMHLPTKVNGRDISRYRNRHGTILQNILAACNFDLEFLFVLARWEGSAHDSKVLNAALTKTNPMTVPQDKYYLVRGLWISK